MTKLTTLTDEALIAFDNLQDIASNVLNPTIRLGVTGLSRSGKTVFISSLIHNLLHGGRLPMFEAQSSGRIAKTEISPQPSMDIPRFEYEAHIETLLQDKLWPQSTRSISEIRLTVHFESASSWNRKFGRGTLNIDIVDYPGEWLLDLPLLGLSFEQWSEQALSLSQIGERKKLAKTWHTILNKIDSNQPANEMTAKDLAKHFTDYLIACRQDNTALSTLPPGRFIMPGDLEGSPALTFSPMNKFSGEAPKDGSLYTMMSERYDAYKDIVVKPFFREHFARLDRQIVLVDVLQALNAGPESLADLENALCDILNCFRTGKHTLIGSMLGRKIDRILFAATKADHLHHENHDKLEALLRRLVENAIKKAKYTGANVKVIGLAAVRATKEALVQEGNEELPVIVGTPLKGENIDSSIFDGVTQTAIFPGDLPSDLSELFDNNTDELNEEVNNPILRFVRFRPPELEKTDEGFTLSLPHIRMDRALQFLFEDHLA